VRARLKTAIIASILPADLVVLRDPLHGDLLLDIPTILAHVATIHGNVTAEDLLVWKAALLEKLSSPADFLKHVALFIERYQKVHLEEPIAPSALFGIFESTFSHHPAFSPSLGRFYETNPDRRKHTVATLVAHITPSLPYIQKLASLSVVAPAILPPASLSIPTLKKGARKAKRSGPNRTDPNRSGPARTEPNRTGPVRTGPVRTGPNQTGPVRTEPNRTDPNRSGPNRIEPVRIEPV